MTPVCLLNATLNLRIALHCRLLCVALVAFDDSGFWYALWLDSLQHGNPWRMPTIGYRLVAASIWFVVGLFASARIPSCPGVASDEISDYLQNWLYQSDLIAVSSAVKTSTPRCVCEGL